MKTELIESIASSNTLNEARERFLSSLAEIKQHNPELRVYYVIGIVTSEGPAFVERNLQLLQERVRKVEEKVGGLVLSAADIFNRELFEKFDTMGATNEDYLNFWEEVLSSKHITDVVRAPGWKRSEGARHENKTAKRLGLPTHDYKDVIEQL